MLPTGIDSWAGEVRKDFVKELRKPLKTMAWLLFAGSLVPGDDFADPFSEKAYSRGVLQEEITFAEVFPSGELPFSFVKPHAAAKGMANACTCSPAALRRTAAQDWQDEIQVGQKGGRSWSAP